MPTRTSQATWNGSLKDGTGRMTIGDGVWEGSYDVPSRFEDGAGTNPEELIGAAHAGCYSMALSGVLTRAGHEVTSVTTTAEVTVDKVADGFAITGIHLSTRAEVPGLGDDEFQEAARQAKENCPVSKALAATEITLDATLAG